MYGTSYRKQLSKDGHKGFKTENRPTHKKPASQVVQMYNYVTLLITFFFCQTTVYFLRKGPWLMAGSSVCFVKTDPELTAIGSF